MFGIFGPEAVRFVDIQGDMLSFHSTKKRIAGTSCVVRFTLNVDGKRQKMDVNVGLVSVRPYQNGPGNLCVGQPSATGADLQALEKKLRSYAMRADLGRSARRSPRYPASLRVLSKDLPGFGGISTDISNHGIRVGTHGDVAIGKEIVLTVNLDIGGSPQLQGYGRVIWSAPAVHTKGNFIGVDFIDLDEGNKELLARYMKSLADRHSGDVMHKSIADGEVYTRPTDNTQKT